MAVPSRRTLLCAIAGVTALAGCLDGDGGRRSPIPTESVIQQTDPVRVQGDPVTGDDVSNADDAATLLRETVAARVDCLTTELPVGPSQNGLLVQTTTIVSGGHDDVAFPSSIHETLQATAPRTVRGSVATDTSSTASSLRFPVSLRATLRVGKGRSRPATDGSCSG